MKSEYHQVGKQVVRVTIGEDEFTCPNCGFKQSDDKLDEKISKSPEWHYYKLCVKCRCKLGVTVDYRGDVQVWMKKYENK